MNRERRTIVFDEQWVEPILEGEKTATVRYGDDAAGLEAGQPVELETEAGRTFHETEIEAVVEGIPLRFVPLALKAIQAEYPIKPVPELADCLNGYYADTITPESTVCIPSWPQPTAPGGECRA